ncbi:MULTISPECIES: hypothetical protein [unclassified Streptomyces]|uniref:hypothetical protein n=1 Tax=unclassified Streptomyces TaxID=2593676 RepID=UPI003332DECA
MASRASRRPRLRPRAGGRLDPHPHAAVRHLGPDRQGPGRRRWHIGEIPQLADGGRVAEIRLGADRIVLAQRNEVAGAADVGFEVLVGCPTDKECEGPTWAPVHDVTDLLHALTGELTNDPGVHCTLHGPHNSHNQNDDIESRTGPEGQHADTSRV